MSANKTNFTDPDEARAKAFITSVEDLLKPDGKGKLELDMEKLAVAVLADPESAAAVVSAVSRAKDVPAMIGQLAISIAVTYEIELGDDSLTYELNKAPWRGKFAEPLLKDPLPAPVKSDPLDFFFQGQPDGLRVLEINATALQTLNIDGMRSVLEVSHPPLDLKRARRQSELWGHCMMAFTALDEDPRTVYFVPEARAYIAKLHEAMPYLPAYFHFRPEAGMFVLYFGSLANPDALGNDGVSVDVLHPSVLEKLRESLFAIGQLARDLGKSPQPIWRTMLSVYPPGTLDDLVKEIEASITP
jgi:hypothetical protein